MKVEIGRTFPANFKALYPEEFELFSHFEVTAAIPTVLFAITTWQENGKPNVCFPVSYTHLDVYKRQALYCVFKNLIRFLG